MVETYDKKLLLCESFWFAAGLWNFLASLLKLNSSTAPAAQAVFIVFRMVFFLLSVSTFILCISAFKEASKDTVTHGDDAVFRKACRAFLILVIVCFCVGLICTFFEALKQSIANYIRLNSETVDEASANLMTELMMNKVSLVSNIFALNNIVGAFILTSYIRQKLRKPIRDVELAASICLGISLLMMLVYYFRGIATGTPASSSIFLMILSKLLMFVTYIVQGVVFYLRDKDVKDRTGKIKDAISE